MRCIAYWHLLWSMIKIAPSPFLPLFLSSVYNGQWINMHAKSLLAPLHAQSAWGSRGKGLSTFCNYLKYAYAYKLQHIYYYFQVHV